VSLQDLIQAQAQREEFQELLRDNAEANLEFYLGESLEFDVPDIHVTIWGLLSNTALDKVLLAIPRGHAKTTLAKLSVVHYFYYTNYRFCVYLSNTNPIAKNACRDIMAYMDSDNHRAVFGEVNLIKASETDSIWIFEIVDVNGRKKKCILRAMGVGQQVRGLNIDNERPDILIGDDVEDRENTATPLLQKNLDDWVFGTLLKALGRTTKIIWIGNIIRKTGLLARLSLDPEWNPVVFGSLILGENNEIKPLWPDLWPLTALIKDFKTYADNGQSETWMCEMMNMPGYGKNGFRIDQINYRPLPLPSEVAAAFITVDPAFGLVKAVNDKTAVVVHALDHDNVPMVVGHIHDHLTETQIFDACLMFAEMWNAWVWGVEAVAAQKVLITLFNFLLASRGMTGAVEILELYAGRGDPKAGRIRAWVNLMGDKQYAIPETDVEITGQLLVYDLTKTIQSDDLIDACAYGPQMISRYLGIIQEAATRPRGMISHNSVVSGVGLTHV
jgi:hypothetical protein